MSRFNGLPGFDNWLCTDRAREDSEAMQERIDARVQELLADRDAVLEADSWVDGTQDYAGMQTVLADLWVTHPDAIFSSNAWRHLLTLQQQAHTARMAKLEEMAEADVAEAAAFRPDMGEAA